MDGFDDSHSLFDAELERWRGELLLAKGANREEAEPCFRKALEAARHQKAKSLELRAALSLSRAMTGWGQKSEARQLLAEIYSWFSEGFETLDLTNVRATLQSLS